MMFYSKKYVLQVIALIGICFNLNAQVTVGIAGTLTLSPSSTVSNSTSVSFLGNFKNTGIAPLTATVGISLAINTSTNATPSYVLRTTSFYPVMALPAGATHSFSISDVVSTTNQYQTDGNGTTVVVWPFILGAGSGSTSDSVFTVVYIDIEAGVKEIEEFERSPLKIENPASQDIILQYDQSVYRKVELMDINGKVIQAIGNNHLPVSGLAKGMYYLNFHNSGTGRVVVKKVLVQ